MKDKFELRSEFEPAGDQPGAIESLYEGIQRDQKKQTLLGVTGSGKTFTIANLIEKANRPALILSQNKTLAAQLYSEFKHFFPESRVEYFVSYFDYYQPEAYIAQTDTYIAKDSAVNDEIEKFRLSATCSLLERRDVIVIASVSCIYGLGDPTDLQRMSVPIAVGDEIDRDDLIQVLIESQYVRNDVAPGRGEFSVSGDVVNIYRSHRDDYIRVEFFGDEIDSLTVRDELNHHVKEDLDSALVFPASHYATSRDKQEQMIPKVLAEMERQVAKFEAEGKLVEAQRIYQRTTYDMEMVRELGFCNGIENYSRYITGRPEGSRPYTLIDFFPEDYLMIVDESHVTIPQFRAMYNGDRSRKMNLVEHGFRLPSALDNRPMKFEEFEDIMGQAVFVSATPADYELQASGKPVELVVRPTGLVDPEVEIRPLTNQVDDLLAEIRECSARDERVIVTCLTKKTSEDLSDYLQELGVKCTYLHSGIDTVERIEVLKELRSGVIDVVIGINLLREGMDLPEVSLVAVLDADKEGFLRSTTALMQIAGRAARNANGRCIMYADKITGSMRNFLDISQERREKQLAFNKENNIVPQTIKRAMQESLFSGDRPESNRNKKKQALELLEVREEDVTEDLLAELRDEMVKAAEALEFERAAALRDKIKELKAKIY
jgi:excinuclease ABC subunit B